MSRPPSPLFKLLLTLFPSNEGVYELISSIEGYSQLQMLLAGLPGFNATRIAYTLTAVAELRAHSQDNEALFDGLAERFPLRKELIETTRRAYFGNTAAASLPDAERPGKDVGPPLTAVAMAAQEKIMGDRATFLDVAYLQRGADVARAVAKLRMRFGEIWFTGTAFLIAPGRLLTAHHNLFDEAGNRADAVTAQFDYVRAPDGPAAEGLTVDCDLNSVRGESVDDWALINLPTAQDGRPLVRFANAPARPGDRVSIIQHPAGMAMQVSLHNNLVTAASDERLQYLTDTLPGSSGAPVFDIRWHLVAMHHAGGDLEEPRTKKIVYRNQGIPVAHLLARMAAQDIALG